VPTPLVFPPSKLPFRIVGVRHSTVIASKQTALFRPVPPVCPSSHSVIDVLVAVMTPLNATHELLVVDAAGLRFWAVDQFVDALGLHFTVHVADAEFVRIQPEIL